MREIASMIPSKKLSLESTARSSRPMCLEERMYLADRQGNPLLRLLPGEDAHLRLRREHRRLHGDSVRMRRDIVGKDQYGRLAMAHEVTRHGKDKVGVIAVHLSH